MSDSNLTIQRQILDLEDQIERLRKADTAPLSTGAQVPRSSGSALFAIDATATGSALSVANDGTATPFGASRNFSGLIIISETAINGSVGLYLIDGGGSVTLVAVAGAFWSVAQGTASKTNIYITASVITLENKLGSTASYNIMALRTRTI